MGGWICGLLRQRARLSLAPRCPSALRESWRGVYVHVYYLTFYSV
eukprot:COSAG06_NODE_64396_length_259_cov_1.293750_1_plen_44_part_10